MELTARNATLKDMAALLQEQHTRKLDLVVPASKLTADGGLLRVDGAEALLGEDGVTSADGVYRPTVVCDEGVAAKLEIPVGYLKRMRADRPDLYDANVNGWLHGTNDIVPGTVDQSVPGDSRSFMLRCFRGDDGGEGIARAFLSDKFRIIDDLDVLTAALEGVRDSGAETEVVACDLTERKMYVHIAAPAIAALAPTLLKGYRSPLGDGGIQRPWDSEAGRAHGWLAPDDQPIVFAGFQINNSEVGGGSFQIVPKLLVKVCKNGLVIGADALTKIHLGGRLEEGIVKWSEDTQRKSLELVTAQCRDAVRTFLDTDYVEMTIERLEKKASVAIKGDANAVVQTVCATLKFGEERTNGILDHFIRGGQMTAGGVMQAATSYAQMIVDADEAHDLEAKALDVLAVAARVAA